jgi:hypothetical protein
VRRLLNPFWLRSAVKQIRLALSGGGPRGVRLVCIGQPSGVIVPIADVVFDVISADGKVTRFESGLPVPWPYAWTYRLARKLGVPVVRSVPEKLEPGWRIGKPPKPNARPRRATG